MRKASMTRTNQYDPETGPNGSTNANERSTLLNHAQEHVHRITRTGSGTPYHEHPNPAVRYPSKTIHVTWEVLKTNYVNVLLVFVPIGIIAGVAGWSPVLQFVLNFIAIIPLASLLAFATEELAVPLGQTLGGLLNATFGNAVELIVSSHRLCFLSSKLTLCRSALSPCAMARSESSKRACWAPSSRISSSFSAAASSSEAFASGNKASTRPSQAQCLP